jgi:phosphatidylinositol-3-phosphatase
MVRSAIVGLLLIVILVAAAYGTAAVDPESSGMGAVRSAAPPTFSKVVVIVFENKRPRMIFDNPAAPTFNALEERYATLTRYDAVSHPSLPNYIALVSGSTQGIKSNCTSCSIAARNLADSLQRAGKTWKTYAQGLPSAGFEGRKAGWYTKKIDPFLYFRDIASNPRRLARVVPFRYLARDVAARRLPDFSLVVPNLCDDMHSCSVATGDSWLRRQLPPLLKSPQLRHGVIFILFDEGGGHKDGGGDVPALVIGPLVRAGSVASTPVDHYSVLRTIEQSWHLPYLGRSRDVAPISGIWRR